ncbi:MAG TPA: putative glycoside hydrolase [Longimicrobiaceae bacterium]|nr:putative glycoside hydrolase [Longimicrobiaceae bacterium]
MPPSPLPTRALLCAILPLAAAACIDADTPPGRAEAALASALVAAPSGALPQAAPPRQAPPPARPRDAMPPLIRGIYVNAYAAGDPRRRAELLALADSTEINAFVVDVKDEDGVRYQSSLPLALEATHRKSIPIRDLAALVDTLRAHGVHAIARVVVFKDPRLSRARPEWSIQTPAGGLWRDRQGISWVSPWDPAVWEYNLDIAEEAVRAGFREVQFDYVRFPEAYRSLPRQVHPHALGERTDAIAGFLAEAGRRLRPLGATVTADLFGLSMNESRDVGIGQQWETLSSTLDHVLPMVYPSHYFPTHLAGVPRPNRMPYETVYRSVGMGVIRNERLAAAGVEPARIVPWLQAFTATWNDRGFPYGPAQAREQVRAVYDLGLEDWIFWHPGSDYGQVAAAFEREAESRAAPFRAPEPLSATVDRFDREGAAAARAEAAAGQR